jgi:amino acid adenylation domain-containing protein
MNAMKDAIEDIYPLSPIQQGILFHTLLDEAAAVYFVQLRCTITGPLDVPAFKLAWQRVVDRHAILRTAFVWEGLKEPMQFVQREVRLVWTEQDWQSIPLAEQAEHLQNFLRQDRTQRIDLSKAPLMRLALLRKAEGVYQFVWSHHHLLLDGWSGARLLQEVHACYQALRQGGSPQLEPSRPYGDYIEWLQQQEQANAEHYWRRLLDGVSAPTPLGLAHASSATHDQALRHKRHETTLTPALTTALKALARQQQLTLNTLVQGAWALLLSRYSGEETVVFGATVSGRPAALPGVESMLGLFINTLPVRVDVKRNVSLKAWLKELQARQAEMRQYEHTPLVQIQGWSAVPRGLPLFESLIVFENYPVDSAFSAAGWSEDAQLSLSDIQWDDLINFPLAIGAEPGPEASLTLRMVYDPRRFADAAISRMMGHLQRALETFVVNVDQPLKALTFLTEAERRQLLLEWNDTQCDYPPATSIVELFAAQVSRTPAAVAVCFEQQCLTYAELDAATNRLARRLQQLGVGPEARVGIYMARSLEMVIAILGVLKAGGAYVPLEPSYPRAHLVSMLAESSPRVLLTQSQLTARLPDSNAPVLCVDACVDALAEASAEPPVCAVRGSNLAYVIYTSGSTGQPKGVMNTHAGLLNRLRWMQAALRLSETDRVLQKTPFSFDVSVWEFLWPLLNGARLIVARPGGHQDSAYLVRLISEQQITIVHFVPSMLRLLLEEQGLGACRSLRHVICSGEALPVELARRFYEHCTAELHNLYGPTEAAIDVTYWRCTSEQSGPTVPIGRPIANTQIYLLDEAKQPVPVGVGGELHIGGINLARGYYGRADLTAEKFIPNPFSTTPGARLYSTGEIARFRPDGSIEFLGRTDAQVKIRGFRIELGEIETTLSRHEQVRATVVLAREDTPGVKRLVAYLVPNSDPTVNVPELRTYLQQQLPEYMIPAAFVLLPDFPRTTSGKIDRRQLPPPVEDRATLTTPFVAPRTPAEKELAAMWRELLGVKQVGIHDNFFELGGHSLLLTQLASRINEAFQVQLPLRLLFNVPSIVELTTAIAARQMEQAEPAELAQMLDDLQHLSPDEMQKLLEAENELTA